ncbi:MAG: hypothetical protein KatS3mg129_0258 [Leptospiraceae bacterium]|nr:MAG: hypothetical protein KatS3mg129_0258 [Leptospiraceae bacterium]
MLNKMQTVQKSISLPIKAYNVTEVKDIFPILELIQFCNNLITCNCWNSIYTESSRMDLANIGQIRGRNIDIICENCNINYKIEYKYELDNSFSLKEFYEFILTSLLEKYYNYNGVPDYMLFNKECLKFLKILKSLEKIYKVNFIETWYSYIEEFCNIFYKASELNEKDLSQYKLLLRFLTYLPEEDFQIYKNIHTNEKIFNYILFVRNKALKNIIKIINSFYFLKYQILNNIAPLYGAFFMEI